MTGWVVHPPVLPANWGPDSIPEETWRRCEQVAREAEEVLSLPEPERTAAGIALFNWIHEGRRAAYSANGGGWLDPGNVIYQYLSLHPLHLLRSLYLTKHPEAATAADAIEKTASRANDPEIAHARETGQKMVLYRGEGTHARPSYYPKGSTDAGGWWTSSRQSAEQYARSTEQGQVYRIEVDPDEVDPRGLPGYFFIPDPKVRERRRLYAEGSKTAGQYNPIEREITLDGQKFVLSFDPIRTPWWRSIRATVGTIKGSEAGYLTWGFDNTIGDVGVQKRWQRRGLATAMLEFAREIVPDLKHSHALTDDGKAWSQAVGSKTAASDEWKNIPGLEFRARGCMVTAFSPEADAAGRVAGKISWYRDGEIWFIGVFDKYRRMGLATELFRRAKEFNPKVHHSEVLTDDGKAWSQAVGSKVAATGGTIWRGLRLPVSDEVRALAKSYWDEAEVAEHRSAKIGQIFLDLMESHTGRHSGTGLGIHWSTRPEMADVAAETSGQRLDWPVVVEATYRPEDVVPEDDDLYGLSGVWQGNKTEAEVLIKPGSRLTVTGLWLAENFAGTNIFSVDDCPKMNIRGTQYRNVLISPQQRMAAISQLSGTVRAGDDDAQTRSRTQGARPQRDHAGPDQEDRTGGLGGHRGGRDRHAGRGRGGLGQEGLSAAQPRPAHHLAAPTPERPALAGPLARSWANYGTETLNKVKGALRDLHNGEVQPDPKQRPPLKGFYTIPFGGTVTSTGDRIILMHQGGVWVCVDLVFDHDYDPAEERIAAWIRAIQRTSKRGAAQQTHDVRLLLLPLDAEQAHAAILTHLDTAGDQHEAAIYPQRRRTLGTWDRDLMHSITKDHGFTMHDHIGDAPSQGFMVSLDKGSEETVPITDISPEKVSDYMSVHQQELRDPNNYLGGWTYKGNVFLDISRHVPDQEQAVRLAKANNQLGIYDLGAGQTIMTPA